MHKNCACYRGGNHVEFWELRNGMLSMEQDTMQVPVRNC